jgi:hypothetical protein
MRLGLGPVRRTDLDGDDERRSHARAARVMAAFDRRVPQVDRAGEMVIARDATALTLERGAGERPWAARLDERVRGDGWSRLRTPNNA